MGVKDKELLSILRQKVPFIIIMHLFYPGFCSKTELAKDLGVYSTTIDFHLKKLLELGVIKPAEGKDGWLTGHLEHKPVVFKKSVGREIFYTWKDLEMAEDVYRLLMTHKKSMLDPKIIDTFNDIIEEWQHVRGNKKPKKHLGFNSFIDNSIKILEEMFPSQFHF
jgi:hypothetical protein